jgi:hypothetical protein
MEQGAWSLEQESKVLGAKGGSLLRAPCSLLSLFPVAQLVDVGKAWDAVLFPHAESTLLRGCSLSKVVVDNSLRGSGAASQCEWLESRPFG